MGDLVHRILDMVTGLGYWGILIGLAIEIIPSEIVLAYAGYMVSQGELNVTEAVVFGTVGCLLQQSVLYAIGIYGGRPFVDKYGKLLHLKPKHIDMTERWFRKYGAGVVFTSRFIPFVRQGISIPAGIARMNLFKFLLYTGFASIPWAILFVELGKTLGENWENVNEKARPYTHALLWAALAVMALYILYMILARKKNRKAEAGLAQDRTVSGELNGIGGEYRVLNGRTIRSKSDSKLFEHLVVGPSGLFHIETRHDGGTVTLGAGGSEGKGSKEDPTAKLYRHEYILKELLREHKLHADVVGILCFLSPDVRLAGSSPSFTAVKLEHLADTIKTHKPKQPLGEAEVRTIAKLLEDAGAPE